MTVIPPEKLPQKLDETTQGHKELMSRDFDLGGVIAAWGRSAEEYEAFLALSDVPASARVLDCGGGPASFTAEWSRRGRFVVAADPIYGRSGSEIAGSFEATAARMLAGMRKAGERFKWTYYGTPEVVVRRRREALAAFLADFESSQSARRYVAASLPELPFPSDSFDLVLCSHLLFLYSEELDTDTHLAFLREMLRVGQEVRVFPLLDMNGRPSMHLETCICTPLPAHVDLVAVPFEFRLGDSKMLRLTRRARELV